MRILQLSTSVRGGAGRAAIRLNNALYESGLDSKIVYLGNGEKTENTHEYALPRSRRRKILSSGVTLLQRKFVQSGPDLVTPITINGLKYSEIMKYSPDIVHIHNYYNLLDFDSIVNISKMVKVVITLHDQRIFTAGCHYSHTCEEFRLNCSDCPQVRPIFRKLVSDHFGKNMNLLNTLPSSISLVSPSKWLLEKAKENSNFSNMPSSVIRNPIPMMLVNTERYFQNETLHVGFCSDLLSNPLKGLKVLLDALENLNRPYLLHLIGRHLDSTTIPANTNYELHCPSNENELNSLLSKLDVLVVPSIEDNSPNVIGEALMSGVKVIGSEVGGIAEIMKESNMSSFNPENPRDLVNILESFDFNYSRIAIAQNAKKIFSYEVIATKMLSFYHE